MPIDANALTSLNNAKAFLGRSDFQHREVGLDIYCSAGDATACTAQVTDTTLVIIVTGGASAGTTTLTFADADTDTLDELVTKVNAVAGMTANLAAFPDEDSDNLVVMPATACLTEANTLGLMVVPDELITDLVNRASDIIENICDRKFKSRTFSERSDGDGTDLIIVQNPPIISLTRVAIGSLAVMSVTNSSTDAMYATAQVTSTVMVLTIVGGANAGSDSPAFAANATISAMVTAINALGKGWVATSVSSLYDAYPTTELIERGAQPSLTSPSYHHVAALPTGNYRANNSSGLIYLSAGSYAGRQQILVEYTGGFATIPDDLEQACLDVVAYLYGGVGESPALQEAESDNWRYKKQAFMDGLPQSTQQTIYRYKNWSGGS